MKVLLAQMVGKAGEETLSAVPLVSPSIRGRSPISRRWAYLTPEEKSCASQGGAIRTVPLINSRDRCKPWRRMGRSELRKEILNGGAEKV
jgi:hypothetical protein